MPSAPRTCLQHPKYPLPKPAQPVPAALLPAPSTLLFLSLRPQPPHCPPGQGTAPGRGQGWPRVLALFPARQQPLLPGVPLSPPPVPEAAEGPGPCGGTGVTQLPCGSFRAGNRDPNAWGASQPPCSALWAQGTPGAGIPCRQPQSPGHRAVPGCPGSAPRPRTDPGARQGKSGVRRERRLL